MGTWDEPIGKTVGRRVNIETPLPEAAGVPFDEVITGAITREIEGVAVPFAGLRDLIRTKDTERPKDHNDALFLRRKLG